MSEELLFSDYREAIGENAVRPAAIGPLPYCESEELFRADVIFLDQIGLALLCIVMEPEPGILAEQTHDDVFSIGARGIGKTAVQHTAVEHDCLPQPQGNGFHVRIDQMHNLSEELRIMRGHSQVA